MAFELTEEQKRAVYDRDGALLVSAAAGSGKTRVLVERLMDRVEQGADVDRFLVITFTRAAAAELRDRVAGELNARLAGRPGDHHLRRQTALIYRANVSTVHAFCSRLLRENAAALELDPDFRLCDKEEAEILLRQTLDRLLDSRYEEPGPEDGFARLVDMLAGDTRDDQPLAEIALDVFRRVQSHPEPERWLEEQERVWRLDGVTDAAETPWGRVLLEDAKKTAAFAAGRLEQALALADRDPVVSLNYGQSIRTSLSGVRALLEAERWDDVRAALPVPFARAGGKPGADPEILARMKNRRDKAKKYLDALCLTFEDTSRELLDDLRSVSPAMRALMALVRDLIRAYDAAKRRRNVVDFSDLEHLAIRLLYDEAGALTPVAESWSARFDEVMVDEFQDTNRVQDAIYRALSGGGKSLFVVGDVKQSIYRFRLADPTIFLEYYRRFAPQSEAEKGQARKVTLSRNFRSRPEVLYGVNDLFRDLMSEELGEMEYSEDQQLAPGDPARAPDPRYRVELDVVALPDRDSAYKGEPEDGGDGEDEEDEKDKAYYEARAAALRVRQMLDEQFTVGEGEGARPMRPEDVMILLRSCSAVPPHYLRAFREQGIPCSAEMEEDFFAATEVNVALSLLQIVDNPRQDVPLISALRSPVYAFSADRLAGLRAAAGKGCFLETVEAAAARGETDCAGFLAELDDLRFGAGDRTCSQMVWHVYQRTGLLGLFSAMPNGEERRERLLLLYELARRQEQAGSRTLFDFLLYLERMRQTGRKRPAAARPADGVRVMTIHASKGLEAPVVLVCGLGRKFNWKDLCRTVLFHPELGVGPQYLQAERGIELNTVARRAVTLALKREMLAEELRLLYVAMTRARDKLILTMALRQPDKQVAGLLEDAASPVPPRVLMECPGVGQWVLLSVLARRSGAPLRALAGAEEAELDYDPPWDVRLVDASDGGGTAALPAARLTDPEGELPDEEELIRRFGWTYPHAGAVDVPSKITATQIKGRVLDSEAAEETGRPVTPGTVPFTRPRFAAEQMGLTPTQRGSALHLAMQFIDYACTGDAEQIRAEVDRLVEQEFLSPLQGQAVDPERLEAFFRSPLGREVVGADAHREYKFSMLVPAGDYYPDAAGEELLLQGVVDCWYDTPEGITVLDFKSDRVTPETVEARARAYTMQLVTYARALGEMTGRPVRRRVLWFFAVDRAIEV